MGDTSTVARARGALSRARAEVRQRRRRVYIWRKRAELDLKDRWNGTGDPLLPPRRYGLVSQYRSLGDKVLDLLVDVTGLEPDERVLDIGCGPGRMAAPLTRHLTSGSYEGFDVTPRAIRWAQRKITPEHPSFHFQIADIHNAMYNPKGTQTGATFRFPYLDDAFDVSFATSVYTHLRPFETVNYLTETARVTRPGGRSLNTFFLLNDESRRLLDEKRPPPAHIGRGPMDLSWGSVDEAGWRFRSPNPETPEHLIVVPEDDVRRMYEDAGLEIVEIRYGDWCGRPSSDHEIGQDVVFARKLHAA